LHSGAGTGIKRIVHHRGSASASDQPRSSPEAEPRLLKKTQLKENIPSYLQAVGQESNYWPVISAEALIEPQKGEFWSSGRITGYPEIAPQRSYFRIGDNPTGMQQRSPTRLSAKKRIHGRFFSALAGCVTLTCSQLSGI
jgi:hypothetical protein